MGNLQLAVGSLFANRFEIDRVAGSGGMGTVYRARDRYSGELVALKLLNIGDWCGGPDEGERFTREAVLLAELRHPGIVSHVAHGQTPDGQRFLAMEWLDGEDLGQRLARGPLPVRQCVTLLSRVADALSVAHQRGIVHRDLKPTNLFLVGGAVEGVKLLDFGIARREVVSKALTRTGMIVGTPEYMAPEQARGLRELSPAADLFSLGCILYECLSGQPPFVADHIAAVLVRILFEEPVPIEHFRPGLPLPVVAILSRLLAKESSQRPADAAALRVELTGLGEVPEPALAATLAGQRPRLATFGENEQSLFSIVLAVPAEDGDKVGLLATLPGIGVPEEEAQQHLSQALLALGAAPNFLANGTLVVAVPAMVSAQDQATMAARAALCVKKLWPEAAVTLATGRGIIKGRSGVGEMVEQAARSLTASGTSKGPEKTPSGIFMDSLSAKLLEGRFAQTPLPGGALLLSEEKEADVSRLLLGRPTPCVGREAELATLEAQLGSCIEEAEARAILITAPPGAGKSRLRHEFLRRVERRSEPVTVLLGRGDLLRAGAAYDVIIQAVRRLCGLSGGEDLGEQRLRLRRRIEGRLPAADRERVLVLLGELCGVPFPEAEHPLLRAVRSEPRSLPERLRRACLDWLAAECQAAPVLFILDDLHWGDELTVALLAEALRELRSAPLFVLALGRPELHSNFPALWQAHKPQEIVLKGLSKRACEQLIRQVLGMQVPAGLLATMVEQSAGNALFLEELIRAGADGAMDSRPDTVLAMLQARIGRMESGPRRAVRAAAVFGQTLWQGGVARLLGVHQRGPEIEGWLQSLIGAELLEPHGTSQIPEEREFGFRHALVRDAAYGLLTESDQKLGHQLAAEFLEVADPQIASAILGYHFRQAGLLDKALKHYLTAAERADRLSLFEEARVHYTATDEVIRGLPSAAATRRMHVDVLIKRTRAGMTSMPAESNLGLLDEARALLSSLSEEEVVDSEDRLRLARVEFYCGRIYNYAAQPARALPYFQRALPVAQEFGERELVVLISMVMGLAALSRGQVAQANELLRPLLGPIEPLLGLSMDAMRCHMYSAVGFSMSGQRQVVTAQIARAEAWVPKSKQISIIGAFLFMKSLCHMYSAEWPEVLDTCQQALAYAQQSGQALYAYSALDALAYAQSHSGLHEQALDSRAQAVRMRKALGRTINEDVFEAVEAEILLNAGRTEEALIKARLVATASQETGLLISYVIAERVWGSALCRSGGTLAEVEAHMARSLEVCTQTQQVSAAALCELWWGRVLRERGEKAAAQPHFDRAFQQLTAGGYEGGLLWARRFAAQK